MKREPDSPARDDEWWARKNDAQIDTRMLDGSVGGSHLNVCGLCGKSGTMEWLDHQHRCGMRLSLGWKP